MSNIDRREFLRLVGAGGVGAGAGFMLAESIKHPVEHLIPYPVPPEEFSPGVATLYNSVCGMCSAGCGITVRTREGRAKKIEGNPLHPVNQGRLCALGQAGLQVLYNPDRVTAPMLQQGERGSDALVPTTWDDALSTVAGRIASARSDSIQILSRGVRGHLAMLFEQFVGDWVPTTCCIMTLPTLIHCTRRTSGCSVKIDYRTTTSAMRGICCRSVPIT